MNPSGRKQDVWPPAPIRLVMPPLMGRTEARPPRRWAGWLGMACVAFAIVIQLLAISGPDGLNWGGQWAVGFSLASLALGVVGCRSWQGIVAIVLSVPVLLLSLFGIWWASHSIC